MTLEPPLIGRDGALAHLLRVRAGLISGWTGSGRSRMLHDLASHFRNKGYFILRLGGAAHEHQPLALYREITPLPVADLATLPQLVEELALAIHRQAGRHPIAILVDDAHFIDPHSLFLLPLLTRRLRAAVYLTARARRRGQYQHPVLADCLRRCELGLRLHLSPLPAKDILALLSANRPARARDLNRVEQLLGSGVGQPGLLHAVTPAPRSGELPPDSPLVTEFRNGPLGPAKILGACHRNAVELAHRKQLAQALNLSSEVADDSLDQLTAGGWLHFRQGYWQASIPALAASLNRLSLDDSERQASSLLPGPARTESGSGITGTKQSTRAEVHRLVRQGRSNQAISHQLKVSTKTVEGHITALLREHSCRNRTQLAAQGHQ